MSREIFITESFAVRTAAHLLHLSSKSYAEHMALDEFYNAIVPLVDKYAEVSMGMYGQIESWPAAKTIPKTTPIKLLEAYLKVVKNEQKDGDDEDEDEGDDDKDADDSQALLNILAELEELTAQTLYKLKFLK
jgi:hypothetical protein